jgi:hypothetical protein
MDLHPRAVAHGQAKKLMSQEKFADAAFMMKASMDNFGPHVLLLIDIASCYYMLNDAQSFQKYTEIGYQEFKRHHLALELNTQKKAALGLGKLLEEAGFLIEALSLYESQARETSDEWIDKIRAHELRLSAELSLSDRLPRLYMICEQIKAKDKDREIDLQNAMMEADFLLFGFERALVRLKRLVNEADIKSYERRLLFFNFLHYALREKCAAQMPGELFELFNYFECDHFEKSLWDLYLDDKGMTPLSPLELNRSEDMSFMSAIRYLFLLKQRQGSDEAPAKKLMLFLQCLPNGSRQLILKNWLRKSTTAEKRVIQVSDQGPRLNGQILDLGKSDNFRRVFLLLNQQAELEVEKAIRLIFETELDNYSFDRLRVMVSRLNKKLESQIGAGGFLLLTKTSLKVHPAFKIERVS